MHVGGFYCLAPEKVKEDPKSGIFSLLIFELKLNLTSFFVWIWMTNLVWFRVIYLDESVEPNHGNVIIVSA